MTKGCGILLLVDEDVIVEAENTEIKRSNGFGRIVKNRHPAKTCPKPAKNYQISPLPLFNSLFSQEKPVRVKGGMSLRNGMWHGLRNDIIMQNIIYGNSAKK